MPATINQFPLVVPFQELVVASNDLVRHPADGDKAFDHGESEHRHTEFGGSANQLQGTATAIGINIGVTIENEICGGRKGNSHVLP